MRYFQQLTLIIALLINPTLSFLVGSVTIRLQISKDIFREGGHNHGGEISQNVHYTSSKLCGEDRIENQICQYHEVSIQTQQVGPPRQAISVEDLTPKINSLLSESGMVNGVVNVISRHTTTAVTINELESRLASDMERYFLSLAPPDERSSSASAKAGVRYFHNDIDLRPDSPEEIQRCKENGWDVDDTEQLKAWREQEPINAHSHLLAMLIGNGETIPVFKGKMVIGQWQSILLVDLDGPRDRTVGVQFVGFS